MKNIYEILKDFGLEIPAEKKTDFEKAWKENYRTKSEYDNAVTKRDEYKSLSRPRQHRHLKRKNSILFLVFLDFPHFFIHSGWQDTLF